MTTMTLETALSVIDRSISTLREAGYPAHAEALTEARAPVAAQFLAQPAQAVDERSIVEAAQQHGMTVEIGATYSLRGQIGQLINLVRALSGEKAEEWTRDRAKLHERKTVHVWLNDLGIEREEFGKPLCLLRRLSILRDRYYEACQQLSFEARKPAGWISVNVRRPERNEPAIYWHKSDFGGFAAIADEWRDEHHLAFATHWMPYTAPASPTPGKEGA